MEKKRLKWAIFEIFEGGNFITVKKDNRGNYWLGGSSRVYDLLFATKAEARAELKKFRAKSPRWAEGSRIVIKRFRIEPYD